MVLIGFTIHIMQHLSVLPFSSFTGIGRTVSERASTKIVRIWLVHATSNGTWGYVTKISIYGNEGNVVSTAE